MKVNESRANLYMSDTKLVVYLLLLVCGVLFLLSDYERPKKEIPLYSSGQMVKSKATGEIGQVVHIHSSMTRANIRYHVRFHTNSSALVPIYEFELEASDG